MRILQFKLYERSDLTLRYHSTLNKKLFNGVELKDDVRQALLRIAEQWRISAHIPQGVVKDIIMTGGNAAYNYTKYSDIDVHLVIDKKVLLKAIDADLLDDYLRTKKAFWAASYNVRIKGYTVELYAQDVDEKLIAEGQYSLLHNTWIKKPHHENVSLRDPSIKRKVDEYTSTINQMIAQGLPEEQFKIIKTKIGNMRKSGLASGGEFSVENLAFKELRNKGLFDKMNKYLGNLKNQSLSLK